MSRASKVRIDLRAPEELHTLVTEAAAKAGVSINTWGLMVLGMAVGYDEQLALAVKVFGVEAVSARKRRAG